MRWKKLAIVGLLLVSLLLASCVPDSNNSGPPSDVDIWGTIISIGSLGFLCDQQDVKEPLFGITILQRCDKEANLVALMRVLIGVLTFALLYMGTSAVPALNQNRNVSIAVSIILAIMSVIFIPNSVLLGIGAAYGTLVAIIMIGAPVVVGFIIYRAMSESHWAFKVLLLVVLLGILTLVKYWVTGGFV